KDSIKCSATWADLSCFLVSLFCAAFSVALGDCLSASGKNTEATPPLRRRGQGSKHAGAGNVAHEAMLSRLSHSNMASSLSAPDQMELHARHGSRNSDARLLLARKCAGKDDRWPNKTSGWGPAGSPPLPAWRRPAAPPRRAPTPARISSESTAALAATAQK